MNKVIKFLIKSLAGWASYLLFVFAVGVVSKITSVAFMFGWKLFL